jgi:hypothetical protein
MASATKKTWVRRELRRKNAGKARKAALRNNGSTPAFPIHTEASVANAPEAQLPPAARAARAAAAAPAAPAKAPRARKPRAEAEA